MTKADRQTLFEIARRCGVESIVTELSAICSYQETHTPDREAAKLWRTAELRLDRLANNLPMELRRAAWQADKE